MVLLMRMPDKEYDFGTKFVICANGLLLLISLVVFMGYLQDGKQSAAGLLALFQIPLFAIVLVSMLSVALRRQPLPREIRMRRLVACLIGMAAYVGLAVLANI